MSDSTTWPAFNVERRAIAELKPYLNNARTHSKEQVAQIAASMQEWGFTNPILIDEDGMIIAGHGRVQAAKVLGVSEVPAIVARGWSEAQKRAYVLADNQLALNSGWDEDLLRLEIGDLKLIDFDLSIIGFSKDNLDNLFGVEKELGSALPQLFGLNYAIVIRCSDEKNQLDLLEQLEQQGLKCEALIS